MCIIINNTHFSSIAPIIIVYESCPEIAKEITELSSPKYTEVWEISTPCSANVKSKTENNNNNNLTLSKPLFLNVNTSKYPADIYSIDFQRGVAIDHQPIFIVVGSCRFVAQMLDELPEIHIINGRETKVEIMKREVSFPVPMASSAVISSSLKTISCTGGNGVPLHSDTCYPVVQPVARAFGFLISWLDSWNWSDALLVGGATLETHLNSPRGKPAGVRDLHAQNN